MSEQYIQIPNKVLKEDTLSNRDIVTYAYLKRHYNHKTKESFPSFDTLSKESGISKPTIMQCVQHLSNANYIFINKIGKTNHYTFSEEKKFEIYSFDFLDDTTKSLSDKAYLIRMQPYLFKDQNLGIGKVTYSDIEIAEKLHIDLRTLHKYENRLQQGEQPIMTLVPTKKLDPDTGLPIQERVFDFDAYNNLIALKFQQVDEELADKVSKVEYEKLLNRVRELEKQINTTEVTPIIL